MKCKVTITVALDVDAADGASDQDIKDEAWFRLFDDNDPSNWPDDTKFDITRQ